MLQFCSLAVPAASGEHGCMKVLEICTLAGAAFAE
jgi:hypothetical protein